MTYRYNFTCQPPDERPVTITHVWKISLVGEKSLREVLAYVCCHAAGVVTDRVGDQDW